MITSNVKIGLLVAGHVVVGVLLAWRVYTWSLFMGLYSALAIGGLVALFLAEAGLVGIWVALGTELSEWRLLAAVLTPTYLCVVLVTALKGWSWRNLEGHVTAYLSFALPMAAICVVLIACRHSRRRLSVNQIDTSSPNLEGLQFTLRHLFILTAIAAVILAVGRGLGNVPTPKHDGWAYAILFTVVVPYLVVVELATLWAALGIGRPLSRLLVVLPMAFVVGAIPPFYLKTLLRQSDLQVYVACSSVIGIQATITAASLLVVRSCGWRLVRLKSELPLDQFTPHSESLAKRIRRSLAGRLEEKEFALGGVRFLLKGNMCVGVWKNSLIARIGPEQGEQALKEDHVSEFNMTGQPIQGLVLVAKEGIEHDDRLEDWIRRSEEFVVTLPGK